MAEDPSMNIIQMERGVQEHEMLTKHDQSKYKRLNVHYLAGKNGFSTVEEGGSKCEAR